MSQVLKTFAAESRPLTTKATKVHEGNALEIGLLRDTS